MTKEPLGHSAPSGSLLRITGYGLGVFGANLVVFPVTSLLLYYLTESIGLTLGLSTLVITVPKVWDMLVDPLIGVYVDQYAQGRGNRFIVFAPLTFALPAVCAALFLLPAFSPTVFAALSALLLILKSTLYTAFLVSHVALADDMAQAGIMRRNSLLSVRIFGQASGGLAAGAVAPLLLATQWGGIGGYPLMAILFAVIGVVTLGLCSAAIRPVPTNSSGEDEDSEDDRPATNIVMAVKAAAREPAALGVIISNLTITMAAAFIAIILPYLNKYVLGGTDDQLTPLFTALMLPMVIGSAVGAGFANRFGSGRAFNGSVAMLLVAALLFYPLGSTLTGVSISLGLWALSMGIYIVSMQSRLMDLVDASDAKKGLLGLLLGLLFSGGKLGDTLGGVLTGGILKVLGFDGATEGAGSPEALRTAFSATAVVCVVVGIIAASGLRWLSGKNGQ
ncbi:MAG: MFS transporter [Pseudomonadota bacterium]